VCLRKFQGGLNLEESLVASLLATSHLFACGRALVRMQHQHELIVRIPHCRHRNILAPHQIEDDREIVSVWAT
jgi:hypothetical protein